MHQVELRVSLPGMDDEQAKQLIDMAHLVCPYSNATLSIPTVVGTPRHLSELLQHTMRLSQYPQRNQG